ncbi:hypothetical protein FRC08_007409 [Ceratobasidium sp. 394]|nr:hypothetical protein FRC08_007409 [Ceratobasidium sp. 394]
MFRNALGTGAFVKMRDAWKKMQGGKWEERKEKKNMIGRRSGRKTAKAENRAKVLEMSELDVRKFAFLANPGFQSSEESDPDDKKHCVVKVPAFCTPQTQKLIGALNVKYTVMKTCPGNPMFTQIEYRLVDIPVPVLKKLKNQRVPGWVVRGKWAKKNPGLEHSSQPYVDSRESKMPQSELVELFVHDHEPDPRVYLNPPADSDGDSEALNDSPDPAPASDPALAPAHKPTPAQESTTSAPAPVAPAVVAPAPDAPAANAPTAEAPALTQEAAPAQEPTPVPEQAETTSHTSIRKCRPTEKGAEMKERKKKKKETESPREPKSKKERIKGTSNEQLVPGPLKSADASNVKSLKLHLQGS